MKIKKYASKLIALFVISLFALSACAPVSEEPPEQVIQEFKETVKDINAADFTLELAMTGVNAEDNVDFNVNTGVKLDRRKGVERKADINLSMDGNLNTGDKNLNGNLDLKIRTIGEDFYLNLMELDANDPSTQNLKPLLDPYQKKWLHLASDFVPESIRELQQKDEETIQKQEQLKELFINTKLLDVNKQFGIENLNGKKVHHYGVRFNKDGLKQYVRRAASVNGREMTDAEVENAVVFADAVTNMELWIGAKDYYLYKMETTLSGGDFEQNAKSDISLVYIANSYNKDPEIEAPLDAEEFNPISLLIGMQFQSPDDVAEEDSEPSSEEMPEGEDAKTEATEQ